MNTSRNKAAFSVMSFYGVFLWSTESRLLSYVNNVTGDNRFSWQVCVFS